ncbi:hypothetical protein [Accumulibacter sp.]|jgi:hypothetical protein|uniref:hypothetical protein n=1 Tax=Accumulibacter sp. TaxID=2053492 RepID=UPI00258A0FA2|nr:hypothetical protein [Accumulibacter sp.]
MAAVFIALSSQPGRPPRAACPIRYQDLVDLLKLGGEQAVKDIVQIHVMNSMLADTVAPILDAC